MNAADSEHQPSRKTKASSVLLELITATIDSDTIDEQDFYRTLKYGRSLLTGHDRRTRLGTTALYSM